MRPALFLLVLAAACESRYGAYLNIDGDSRGIQFDRVELYFGKPLELDHYATPTHAELRGRVFKRVFDPSDMFAVEGSRDVGLRTSTTYWVPGNDANQNLGAYVAAVVFAPDANTSDVPVGIGELFDVKIDTDRVTMYDIELQPFLGAERWGGDPSCLSWPAQRDGVFTSVGVVRDDDLDCDGLTTTADCNDSCPTGSIGCSASSTFCPSPDGTCTLGCAAGTLCRPTTCVLPAACSASCILMGGTSRDLRLDCALNAGGTHYEAYVQLDQQLKPCTNKIVVPLAGQTCTMPVLEYVQRPNATADYVFKVSDDGTNCLIELSSPTNAPLSGIYHLLMSFSTVVSGPRPSVIIGIQPGDPGSTGTCGEPRFTVVPDATGITLCP